MMPAGLLAAGAAGLLGSLHCVGMCGPLLAGIALVSGGRSRALLWAHAGRLWTYALLGLLAGACGGSLQGRGRAGGILLALAFAAAALVSSGALRGLSRAGLRIGRGLSRIAPALRGVPGPAAPLLLGACQGLLPCGLVYTALLLAAGSASALGGAATMLCFGLGTIPALVGFAALPALLPPRLRVYLPRLATVVLLLGAGTALWRSAPGSKDPACHETSRAR